MKDIIFDQFQNEVDETLLRHRSILDIITKLDESQTRINRALIKAATNCGCITIKSTKQTFETPEDLLDKSSFSSNFSGALCDNCRDVIEKEIGNNLFYLAALCNTLDLNVYDVLLKEYNKLDTLGKFSLR